MIVEELMLEFDSSWTFPLSLIKAYHCHFVYHEILRQQRFFQINGGAAQLAANRTKTTLRLLYHNIHCLFYINVIQTS